MMGNVGYPYHIQRLLCNIKLQKKPCNERLSSTMISCATEGTFVQYRGLLTATAKSIRQMLSNGMRDCSRTPLILDFEFALCGLSCVAETDVSHELVLLLELAKVIVEYLDCCIVGACDKLRGLAAVETR